MQQSKLQPSIKSLGNPTVRISRDALLAAGFEQDEMFFNKGKLSVYWREEDNEYFLGHEYPLDYEVTDMKELHALNEILNRPGLRHFEMLMAGSTLGAPSGHSTPKE